MTQRLLHGVVGAIALAMVMTTTAHARTSIEYGHADDNRPRMSSERIIVHHRATHRAAKKRVRVVRSRPQSHKAIREQVSNMAAAGDTALVSKARAYIGMNARQIGLHRYDLWCSAFMRYVAGTPRGVDDRAISWSGQKHIPGQVGAIVIVRSRRMHVGVVSGFDAGGNPKVISGNHRNRVAESVYSKARVVAYVSPSI